MERLPQRDDIQGLRAIAVHAVILFHVDRALLPGGFTGVDIFLVISGFLITSIILRQRQEGSFSYLSFYISRIRRIVPAYLVLLAAVTFCMAILLTPKDYGTYEDSLLGRTVLRQQSLLCESQRLLRSRITRSAAPPHVGLIIAGMWQYHFKSERFLHALDRFLAEASRRNQRVIVLAQVPMLESNVQRRYRFERLGIPHSHAEKHPEWRAANQRIQELVTRHPLVTFLDMTEDPLFLLAPFENGVLLYSDSHHLNEVGFRRYGEVALSRLSTWATDVFIKNFRP